MRDKRNNYGVGDVLTNVRIHSQYAQLVIANSHFIILDEFGGLYHGIDIESTKRYAPAFPCTKLSTMLHILAYIRNGEQYKTANTATLKNMKFILH